MTGVVAGMARSRRFNVSHTKLYWGQLPAVAPGIKKHTMGWAMQASGPPTPLPRANITNCSTTNNCIKCSYLLFTSLTHVCELCSVDTHILLLGGVRCGRSAAASAGASFVAP